MGIAAAVANRWFFERVGLAMGLLFAVTAAGQLVFLRLLAMLVQHHGWLSVSVFVTVAVAIVVPMVALLLPESPAHIGLAPYGSTAAVRRDTALVAAVALPAGRC